MTLISFVFLVVTNIVFNGAVVTASIHRSWKIDTSGYVLRFNPCIAQTSLGQVDGQAGGQVDGQVDGQVGGLIGGRDVSWDHSRQVVGRFGMFNFSSDVYTICMSAKKDTYVSSHNGRWHLGVNGSNIGNGNLGVHHTTDDWNYICVSNNDDTCVNSMNELPICDHLGGSNVDGLYLSSDWTINEFIVYDRVLDQHDIDKIMSFMWSTSQYKHCKIRPVSNVHFARQPPLVDFDAVKRENYEEKMNRHALLLEIAGNQTLSTTIAGVSLITGSSIICIVFIGAILAA